MTETEFLTLANNYISHIENLAETWISNDIDLDVNRQGNVLTLDFNGKHHIVLNIQTPMKELWLASINGAYHYKYANKKWENTREGGIDLDTELSNICSQFAGKPLVV